jgi:hypothetical protein
MGIGSEPRASIATCLRRGAGAVVKEPCGCRSARAARHRTAEFAVGVHLASGARDMEERNRGAPRGGAGHHGPHAERSDRRPVGPPPGSQANLAVRRVRVREAPLRERVRRAGADPRAARVSGGESGTPPGIVADGWPQMLSTLTTTVATAGSASAPAPGCRPTRSSRSDANLGRRPHRRRAMDHAAARTGGDH